MYIHMYMYMNLHTVEPPLLNPNTGHTIHLTSL